MTVRQRNESVVMKALQMFNTGVQSREENGFQGIEDSKKVKEQKHGWEWGVHGSRIKLDWAHTWNAGVEGISSQVKQL